MALYRNFINNVVRFTADALRQEPLTLAASAISWFDDPTMPFPCLSVSWAISNTGEFAIHPCIHQTHILCFVTDLVDMSLYKVVI